MADLDAPLDSPSAAYCFLPDMRMFKYGLPPLAGTAFATFSAWLGDFISLDADFLCWLRGYSFDGVFRWRFLDDICFFSGIFISNTFLWGMGFLSRLVSLLGVLEGDFC
jgi:hypothetical protein